MGGQIDSLQALALANGHRPRVVVPNHQWLSTTPSHPFRVGCTLKNGAVTSSDLTTEDAWFEDCQVRTAYTPVNGATTRLRAIVQVEAARVLVSSSVFSVLDATVKDDATAQLYLYADTGGQQLRVDLRSALYEPPSQFQKTQTAAADGTHWILSGGWVEIPGGPFAVDLETNVFRLESLNSVAYGADITQCWVELLGDMVPKGAPGATPWIRGGSCGPLTGAVRDYDVLSQYGLGVPQLVMKR